MDNRQVLVVNGGKKIEGELEVHGKEQRAAAAVRRGAGSRGEYSAQLPAAYGRGRGMQDIDLPGVQMLAFRKYGVRGRCKRQRKRDTRKSDA